MDEITVGARYYNNGAGPQHVDGFGRADIAELLIYNRTLAPANSRSVHKYLDARYAFIKDVLPPDPEAVDAARNGERPAARAGVRARLLRAAVAARPDEYQQRQVSRRRHARRPGLRRQDLAAPRHRRRRPRRQGRPVLGQRERPSLADRHGPHAAGLRARQRRVRRRQDALRR